MLALRLTELYKADRPDALTVILNSRGFADLLERSEFMQRINEQDTRVIVQVRVARNASQRASDRLASLESRQQRVTTAVLVRRNQVASVRLRLVDKSREFAQARSAKAAILSRVRSDRHEAEEDLAAMEREQARIRGVLTTGPGAAGPIRRGSGSFIWPVNGPITGSFGENRGDHMHAGIDISAPTGTAIRAVASGTVALAGWTGGYGQLHLHPARGRAVQLLRAPVEHRRERRAVGVPGAGDRSRGLDRQLDRAPSALRDPLRRLSGQPAVVPVGRRRTPSAPATAVG